MKIILRDSQTGLYYGGDQSWCAEVSGAINFDSIGAGASVAQEQRLEMVEVVLRYEEPPCELVLPLAQCIPNVTDAVLKGQPPRHLD
jgi:hypothetical protein